MIDGKQVYGALCCIGIITLFRLRRDEDMEEMKTVMYQNTKCVPITEPDNIVRSGGGFLFTAL